MQKEKKHLRKWICNKNPPKVRELEKVWKIMKWKGMKRQWNNEEKRIELAKEWKNNKSIRCKKLT